MNHDEEQMDQDLEGESLPAALEFDLTDPSTLLAVLLVYIARGDGEISSAESQKMVDLLVRHYEIRTPQAMERLSGAVMRLAEGDDLLRDVAQAAAQLLPEQKREIFKLMLEVAAADEIRHAEEIEALAEASGLLGLSEEERHQAYQAYFDQST